MEQKPLIVNITNENSDEVVKLLKQFTNVPLRAECSYSNNALNLNSGVTLIEQEVYPDGIIELVFDDKFVGPSISLIPDVATVTIYNDRFVVNCTNLSGNHYTFYTSSKFTLAHDNVTQVIERLQFLIGKHIVSKDIIVDEIKDFYLIDEEADVVNGISILINSTNAKNGGGIEIEGVRFAMRVLEGSTIELYSNNVIITHKVITDNNLTISKHIIKYSESILTRDIKY